MNTRKRDAEDTEVSTLVLDLLRLDPGELASMKRDGEQKNDAVLLGLKEFLRRVFQFALELRDTDASAVALTTGPRWPGNERVARLGVLLSWSLAREFRWYQGRPFLALEAEGCDLPRSDIREAMSMEALIEEITEMPTLKPGVRRDSSERYPVSIRGLVAETLAVDPLQLAARFSDEQATAAAAFAQDPEGQTRLGLECVVKDAIQQYRIMRERNIDRIRLMGEEDAAIAGRPNAHIANLITLLSAALHADDEHVIAFEAPRPRPSGEEDALRASARLVYADYSHEAMNALELLCDRNIHFGSFGRFSRAEQLLAAIGREVDPKGERMPFMVAVQALGFDAFTTPTTQQAEG